MTNPKQQTDFVYRNIELYKSESLGSGSYGGVCKAKCDGLLCAAKIMHPTFFDRHDSGTVSYQSKFQEECRLLSLARHPNIVQYLATYCDPETRLPVLLMELCNESLTRFLERSPGPVPYHVQLNIGHDIALALVYLHSNGLIHRDLTGNNVLMIAATRAKVTDFGMSKLYTAHPRKTALTLCPGNVLYMSPEALNEVPRYSDKLDVFSFGVLQVQIVTRQFPNPTDRFEVINDPQYDEEIRLVVLETQRRQAHLQLISDNHPLKPLALQCLKNKDRERPSAQQLSERMSELKLAPQYTESVQHAHAPSGNEGRDAEGIEVLRGQVQELQKENSTKQQQIEQLFTQIQQVETELDHDATDKAHQENQYALETKERELQHKQQQLQASEEMVSNLEKVQVQLQCTIKNQDRVLQEKHHAVVGKESELQASEKLVSEFQQSLQQKDKTISELQQTISALKRNIQQLEQQERATGGRPQQLQSARREVTASNDITKLRWREGKKAPQVMQRGAAVVLGSTAYFNPEYSHHVYSYQIISGEEQWSKLPNNTYKLFSLAVVGGLVTSVGGYQLGFGKTNTLLSLTGESGKRQWSQVFPPMPTARSRTAAVSTEFVLVIAGGFQGDKCLLEVEVMNISTKQWTVANPLSRKLFSLSGTTCRDRVYLAGDLTGTALSSKYVLSCSFTELLPPTSKSLGTRLRRSFSQANQTGVWKEVCGLNIANSSLTTLSGHLLAIGGNDVLNKRTAVIHRYDPNADSWHVIGEMKTAQTQCLVAVFPEDRIVVVGGHIHEEHSSTDGVQIAQY